MFDGPSLTYIFAIWALVGGTGRGALYRSWSRPPAAGFCNAARACASPLRYASRNRRINGADGLVVAVNGVVLSDRALADEIVVLHSVHADFIAGGVCEVWVEALEVGLPARVGEHHDGHGGIAILLQRRLEGGEFIQRAVLHDGIEEDDCVQRRIGARTPSKHGLCTIAVAHGGDPGAIGKGQGGSIAQQETQIVERGVQVAIDVQVAGIGRLIGAAQHDVPMTRQVLADHRVVFERAAQPGMVNHYGEFARRRGHVQRGVDRRGEQSVPGNPLLFGELFELLAEHVPAGHVAGELAQALGEFGHGRIQGDGAKIVAVDHGGVVLLRRRIPDGEEDGPRLLDGRTARGRIVGVVGARHVQLIERAETHRILARPEFAPKLRLCPSAGGSRKRRAPRRTIEWMSWLLSNLQQELTDGDITF